MPDDLWYEKEEPLSEQEERLAWRYARFVAHCRNKQWPQLAPDEPIEAVEWWDLTKRIWLRRHRHAPDPRKPVLSVDITLNGSVAWRGRIEPGRDTHWSVELDTKADWTDTYSIGGAVLTYEQAIDRLFASAKRIVQRSGFFDD